jgi:hypothetical protein
MVFQQLVGINTAMYYGPEILLQAGFSLEGYTDKQAVVLFNIPLAAMNAFGNTLSIFFIDKCGRRYLMLRMLPLAGLGHLICSIGMGYVAQD